MGQLSPSQLKDEKMTVRQSCLRQRDALKPAIRKAKSKQICLHLLDYLTANSWVKGKEISAFLPIRSEVDLTALLKPLQSAGALLSLPVVLDRETICFRRYQPNDDLMDAGFGTVGPNASAPNVDPEILLMPLAGFDLLGGRLGYGAGHYDRALQRLIKNGKEPLAIGIAYGLQEVPKVPVEDHDMPLAAIVTENGPIVLQG